MLRLTQINIYPVKSLDGYSPQTAIVEPRGLRYDRRWLITDEKGMFITQRTEAKMAQLKAIIENDTHLIIYEKANEKQQIKIPITQTAQDFAVEIWDDKVNAFRISDEADAFLSDFLAKKCHLVAMKAPSKRPIDPDFALRPTDEVSFADGFPMLLLGEAAVAYLRTQFSADSELRTASVYDLVRRFRPNLVFSGGKPHDEDNFRHFRIGEIPFVGVKPCGRCVLTTRDPDTGKAGKDPLSTLKNYRQQGKKILFGQNVIWNEQAWQWAWQPEIAVGDVLHVN
jgi:hypothetical protein